MCVCVKHVIVGCCFVLLLLGTSIRASGPVRIYRAGARAIISVSQSFFILFFPPLFLEVCMRFNNSLCKGIIN